MSNRSIVDAAIARIDSWYNVLTGVGGGVGKNAFDIAENGRLDEGTLRALFREDAYARRICTAVPSMAMRQGVTLVAGDKVLEARVMARWDELFAAERIQKAWTWGRAFGGGMIFVGADDGQDPSMPLIPERVRRVKFLVALERRQVFPQDWCTDTQSPLFGTPERYRFQRNAGGGGSDGKLVHASRMIRFGGAMTTSEHVNEQQGWDDSVLQAVWDKLQKFNAAFEATGTLLQDASQGVFKMQNLIGMMSADKQDFVKSRMGLMDRMRSLGRAIVIDANESFDRSESSILSGFPGVLDKYLVLLAGAVPMPLTVLMGSSPAGLNATGESDMRIWYDEVQSERQNYCRPKAERIIKLLLIEQQAEPKSWHIEFPSLYQLTPVEMATWRKTVAETDHIYIQDQVITPEEASTSRFPEGGWSAETTIDLEPRQVIASADAGANGTQPANDTTAAAPSVAEQAMNGAQVTSLQGIVTACAANELPVGTAREIIAAAFPELSADRIEKMLAPIAGQAGQTTQLADVTAKHAVAARSVVALRSTLKRLIAKYGHAGSVVGIGGSGAGVSDADLDAAVAEVETAEETDAGAPAEGAPPVAVPGAAE